MAWQDVMVPYSDGVGDWSDYWGTFRRLHSRWHTLLDGGLQSEAIGDVITRAGQPPGSRSASPATAPDAASPPPPA
ncbi:hypothetical protein [Streptomyces sp. NPDC058424]|uniref:hypothetical protein n=1 Tax=Streptomyces sp. NPDC058424 TaxID=3346491 RepID=UPI003666098A